MDGVATYRSARLPCPGRYESIAAGACIIPAGLVLPAGYAQDRWPPWWGAFDGNGLHSGPVRRRTGQTELLGLVRFIGNQRGQLEPQSSPFKGAWIDATTRYGLPPSLLPTPTAL